jgi:hypothetical protein
MTQINTNYTKNVSSLPSDFVTDDGATGNDVALSVSALTGELIPETVGISISQNAGMRSDIIDIATIDNAHQDGGGLDWGLATFADATNTDSVINIVDVDAADTAPAPLIYIGSNTGEAVNAMTNAYSAAGATVGMDNTVGDGASLTVDNCDNNAATQAGLTNFLDILGSNSVPTNIESSNWSGAVITAASGESFSTVSATWVVPTISQVPLTGVTLTDIAEWVGIDGYNSGDVCQAGILETAQTSGGHTTISISAWVEWYPADAILISASAFQVNAGNTIKVTVETTGAGATTATFILDDETTGHIYDTTLTAPAGTTLEGNSAEFIVETPELISGNQVSQPLLSDFLNSPVVFENVSATYANNSSVSLSSAQSIGMWTDNVPGSQGSSVQEAYGSIAANSVTVTEDDYWGGSTSTSNGPTLTAIVDSPSSGDLNAGKTVTITLDWTEAVTVAGSVPTLALNDGGTATYSSGSGSDALIFSYTIAATDTSVASLAVTAINLNGGTLEDAAGNNADLSLSGLSQTGPQIGTIPATVEVAIDSSDVNLAHDTATVTFSFSAAPATFTLADTSAVGGALSNLQEVNSTVYTATFTGAANTDISNATVSTTAGSWEEVNGTSGAGGSTSSFVVDTVTPTVAVAINSGDVNFTNDTATVTFTFSEAPTTFTLADTSAVGGALSNLQEVNGTTYTAAFTGATNTDISDATVSVTAGSWEEVNGNPGAGGSTVDFTVDTIAPTLNANSFTVGAQHSVAASSFLTISNPTGDSISEYSFEDIGGNGHFVVAGSVEPAGQQFTVSASNLGNVQYVGGSSAGTDTIVVDVYDATVGAWLPAASVNAVTTAPFPLANVSDVTEALYIGYFGRAADPGGDAYWLNQLSSGKISELGVAASFSVQTEATALYPFLVNPSTATQAQRTSFVESVYGDLFDRAADVGGLAYWQSYLTANLGNPNVVGAFVLTVINGALGADQVTISNKVTVADYFTQQLGSDGIGFTSSADSLAHTVIASVTSSPSTVLAAESTINTWLATEVALLGTSHTSDVSGVAHI